MKLTIERAALLKALGHVQSVVERRNTFPILSNVFGDAPLDQFAADLGGDVGDVTGDAARRARVMGPALVLDPSDAAVEYVLAPLRG